MTDEKQHPICNLVSRRNNRTRTAREIRKIPSSRRVRGPSATLRIATRTKSRPISLKTAKHHSVAAMGQLFLAPRTCCGRLLKENK